MDIAEKGFIVFCIHRFEKIGIDSSIPTGNEQSHVFFNSAARQIWSISAKIYMKRSVSHQIKRKLFTKQHNRGQLNNTHFILVTQEHE